LEKPLQLKLGDLIIERRPSNLGCRKCVCNYTGNSQAISKSCLSHSLPRDDRNISSCRNSYL